jgi:hypothetical protein
VVDTFASLNGIDAIDNLSGLIEFKRYFGQAVQIAVWMRTHHKCNLWFGEPDFDGRSHRACSAAKLNQCLCHRSLVAFRAVRGLLLFAKDLFVAANTVAWAASP